MELSSRFFFGISGDTSLPAFKWWNSKRLEYNLRFLGCLLAGQVLLLMTSYSLGLATADNILNKIAGALISYLMVLAVVNLVYFLWPALELLLFRANPQKYRSVCFAVLNGLSLALFVAILFLIFAIKA